MSNRRRVGWIVIAALLGFSCAPVLSPSLIPTLDPFSLSTAIALTADAASVQTAAVSQPILAATPAVANAGPTLDSDSLNTAIAQTAGAAATQTAGMIPLTLTPSITPFPSWTPTIVPSPTPTFLLRSLPTATLPKSNPKGKPTPTHKVTEEPPPVPEIKFDCAVLGVAPANNSIVAPNTRFKAYWTVRNTGTHHWQRDSLDIIYAGGTILHTRDGYDFSPYPYVPSGYSVTLPGVDLIAPSSPGTYSTLWQLRIAKVSFCSMRLTIIVP